MLRKRVVNFTITRDPFMQGYQPVEDPVRRCSTHAAGVGSTSARALKSDRREHLNFFLRIYVPGHVVKTREVQKCLGMTMFRSTVLADHPDLTRFLRRIARCCVGSLAIRRSQRPVMDERRKLWFAHNALTTRRGR